MLPPPTARKKIAPTTRTLTILPKTFHARLLQSAVGNHGASLPLKAISFKYMVIVATIQGFFVQ